LKSGPSEIALQGKIEHVLSHDISSKLAYKGNVDVPFLNYFFPKETFGGKSDVAGFLEFRDGYFSTQGQVSAKAVEFNGWRATPFNGEIFYRFRTAACHLRS
jgi:hypothetical protein